MLCYRQRSNSFPNRVYKRFWVVGRYEIRNQLRNKGGRKGPYSRHMRSGTFASLVPDLLAADLIKASTT